MRLYQPQGCPRRLEILSHHVFVLGPSFRENFGERKEPICMLTTAHVRLPIVLYNLRDTHLQQGHQRRNTSNLSRSVRLSILKHMGIMKKTFITPGCFLPRFKTPQKLIYPVYTNSCPLSQKSFQKIQISFHPDFGIQISTLEIYMSTIRPK